MSENKKDLLLDDLSEAKELLLFVRRSQSIKSDHPLEMAIALQLMLRAAQVLALVHIHKVKDSYPVTNQSLMNQPEAEIDVKRDSRIAHSEFIGFLEILDLFSDEFLPCVAAHIHRGWQDRTQSCREARKTTCNSAGFSLSDAEREGLSLSLAISNRVFCSPPPVNLDAEQISEALDSVLAFIKRLSNDAEIISLVESLQNK